MPLGPPPPPEPEVVGVLAPPSPPIEVATDAPLELPDGPLAGVPNLPPIRMPTAPSTPVTPPTGAPLASPIPTAGGRS